MDLADVFLAQANRPTIVSDIDGVLAFLTETIVTALNARYDLSIVVDEMRNYRIENDLPAPQRAWLAHQFERAVFYANAAPDYSSISGLGAIHRAGYHVIVSSDRPTSVRATTQQWLDKWRVAYDQVKLLGKGGKQTVLAAHGPDNPAILIDDDPSKALTIARPGVQVWSPQRPWTPRNWRDYPNFWVFPSWMAALNRLGVSTDVPIPAFSTAPAGGF